ncbi:hypothetical protein C8F04DRAFT_1178259 [Mycena alexandri]|uniref:SWIM-type domain-containing protein n=1 Tax=Mycena alexandri TaxID=1745969 RepID=A0AAD6X5W4_9AGAR|nr:hypothetical protein C8F04DRAFT_1178259 [Mycena alexandri]
MTCRHHADIHNSDRRSPFASIFAFVELEPPFLYTVYSAGLISSSFDNSTLERRSTDRPRRRDHGQIIDKISWHLDPESPRILQRRLTRRNYPNLVESSPASVQGPRRLSRSNASKNAGTLLGPSSDHGDYRQSEPVSLQERLGRVQVQHISPFVCVEHTIASIQTQRNVYYQIFDVESRYIPRPRRDLLHHRPDTYHPRSTSKSLLIESLNPRVQLKSYVHANFGVLTWAPRYLQASRRHSAGHGMCAHSGRAAGERRAYRTAGTHRRAGADSARIEVEMGMESDGGRGSGRGRGRIERRARDGWVCGCTHEWSPPRVPCDHPAFVVLVPALGEVKGKRWRAVKKGQCELSEDAHKRLDKEQAVVQRGEGRKGGAVAGRALRAAWGALAGSTSRLAGIKVEGESGCSAVSIFAVDADDDVGMGSALRETVREQAKQRTRMALTAVAEET